MAERAAGRFRVPVTSVAWQEIDDLGALGLSAPEAASTLLWVDAYGRVDRGSRALGRALTMGSGAAVVVGWALLTPPFAWLGALACSLVSSLARSLARSLDHRAGPPTTSDVTPPR